MKKEKFLEIINDILANKSIQNFFNFSSPIPS